MRLIRLTVENFRCYASPVSVRFDDLTAFVGQNDVGKSSLLDALAIFFEEASPDKDDACKVGNPENMCITCEFDALPECLVVDTNFPTTLKDEYLLSHNETLIVKKTYNGSLATPKLTAIVAIAKHPTEKWFHDLLTLKKKELVERARSLNVDLKEIDKRINAPIRDAIWKSSNNLELNETDIPLNAEGGKQVWEALQLYLPTFALFKSDRASTDQDAEAQDPLKAAIREAVKAVEPKFKEIKDYVESEVNKIAAATVDKLREMDLSLAETLKPVITTKKMDSLFSTSITGDEGIPLNKRGSGVKRLVLLNFFRAKAEQDAAVKESGSVIYAIEEPETSQHPRNQRLLMNIFSKLSASEGQQVIVTTHTPMLARHLPESDIRFIERSDDGGRSINEGSEETLAKMAESLGMLADHNVEIFIGVEGKNDINFLKGIATMLINAGEDVPNLEQLESDGKLIFFPLGGSNLALWTSRLSPLNRPEFHIYDSDLRSSCDQPKYADKVEQVNAGQRCSAISTGKREIENYLHPEAVSDAYHKNGTSIDTSLLPKVFDDFDNVPEIVAKAVQAAAAGCLPWANIESDKRRKKEGNAKRLLNREAVSCMTIEHIKQTDPNNEIIGWLHKIAQMMEEYGS